MQQHRLLPLLFLASWGQASATPESEQLALTLKQLDNVKTTLARAASSAKNGPPTRYYFDYLLAQQDINAMESGIRRYLSPARAQPRLSPPLDTHFLREDPRD